jgi:hypothetical protein
MYKIRDNNLNLRDMKKLVVSIAVFVSSVTYSQVNDSVSTAIVNSFNSFTSAKNFNECFFNKKGFKDNNTNLYKITPEFFHNKSVRIEYANDANVKRMKFAYSKADKQVVMLGEWILNYDLDFDTTYHKTYNCIFIPEEGAAVQSVSIRDSNNILKIFIQFIYEFDPIDNYSSKQKLPSMNLCSIISYDYRIK